MNFPFELWFLGSLAGWVVSVFAFLRDQPAENVKLPWKARVRSIIYHEEVHVLFTVCILMIWFWPVIFMALLCGERVFDANRTR
jgi:hypothetical protein